MKMAYYVVCTIYIPTEDVYYIVTQFVSSRAYVTHNLSRGDATWAHRLWRAAAAATFNELHSGSKSNALAF